MYLREVCSDNFVLLQADWSVDTARQIVERLDATHVVVHRAEPGRDYYYLSAKGEALDLLRGAGGATPVSVAFDCHEYTATQAFDAYSDAATAPDRSVVIEAGHVVGFYDKTLPPSHLRRAVKGAATTGSTTGTQPIPRSLTADFPEKVRLQETHSLLVSLSAEPGSGIALPVALPKGAVIDVVVQPNRGFVLVDSTGEGSLVVVDDPRSSLPLQFKLKATELGVGTVSVCAFHQQQPLGKITLAPTVVAPTGSVGERREYKQEIATSVRVVQPDLSLMICEGQSNGKPTLTFRLSALDPSLGFHLKPFGPVELQVDPLKYFQEFFEDIENLPLGTEQEKAIAERRMAAKGCMLFEKVIPQDLQVILWSVRNQIKSVQIDSDEPWIPWELCKLEGRESGRPVEGPFFCEAFEIARWLMGPGMSPALKLKNMALVVPKDSGLPLAASEGSYVLSLASGGRKVSQVPATYLEVTDAMSKGEYDGWHFTGHGGFAAPDPNRSVILLEGGQKLMPEDLSGVVKNVGIPRPLVFLNACQIGRSALSLTGIGGWASRFLEAGAGAFIGAYWSVYDQAAHDFAEALYGRLLGGMNIGKAVQEARLAIKPLGDPTWLAYTVFADPGARVVS